VRPPPPSTATQNAAIRAFLSQVRQELVAVGLMADVAPAFSTAPGILPREGLLVSIGERRRDLIALEAQMNAAGLLPRSARSTA
jgi:hypothetical protein